MTLTTLILSLAVGYGAPVDANQVQCLSEAIWFESRSEPIAGQVAVAITIMNRVGSAGYPDTVCEVVNQPYQFSYTLLPKQERARQLKEANKIDSIAKELAVRIALQAITGGFNDMHVSQHYYNPDKASPKWAASFDHSMSIGSHRWVW
jgi:spore germination cell wall hydrolase CwlJ-like protein